MAGREGGNMSSHAAVADGNWHGFGASHASTTTHSFNGSTFASTSHFAAPATFAHAGFANIGWRGGWGWGPGPFVAGALVGGALAAGLASPYYYSYGPYYPSDRITATAAGACGMAITG